MRGGVVGKHYGGGGGGGGDGRMQRLGNRREENAERSAAPLAGVGVRGNAPSAKHRDGAVREKYVSPYGQRR
jgi:hypothetical protein